MGGRGVGKERRSGGNRDARKRNEINRYWMLQGGARKTRETCRLFVPWNSAVLTIDELVQ